MTIRARDGRPSTLPPITELAARVRDGEDLRNIAEQYGVAYSSLTSRFSQAGYASTGEKVGDAQRRQLREAREPATPKWVRDGDCTRVDPEAWFPDVGGSPKAAKEICRGCPSKEPCLQWAMEHNERWGVWGATTYEERVKIRRARQETAA
jgi:hypothetical protein